MKLKHIFKFHSKGLHDHLENFELQNISQDAIINSEILEMKFLGLQPEMPTEIGGMLIPEEFKNKYKDIGKDAFTTPRLYAWYENKKKPMNKKEFSFTSWIL